MDKKYIKPVVKAAVLLFILNVAYFGLFFVLNAIDKPLGNQIMQPYLLFGLVIGVVSIPLMGLLAVYFYKKEANRLTMGDGILVALTAACFLTLLDSLLSIVVYGYSLFSIYSAASGGQDSPIMGYLLLAFILVTAISIVFSLLISVVGSIFGAFLGALLLTTKEEKKKWGIKPAYLWTYIGIVILLIAGFAAIAVFLYEPWTVQLPEGGPGCTGFSQVKPIDWKASSDGQLHLNLMNDAGLKIRLNNISVSVFGESCSDNIADREMRAGEFVVVNVTDCNFPAVGEYYKTDITISYASIASGIDHNSVGECHGVVEDII
jgi:MFS family permease